MFEKTNQEETPTPKQNIEEKLQHESLIVELGAALEAARVANVGGSYGGKTAI